MPTFAYNIDIPPFIVTKLQNVKNAPMKRAVLRSYENGYLFPLYPAKEISKSGRVFEKSETEIGSIFHFPTRISQAQNQQKSEKSSSSIECIFKGLNVYSKGNVAILIVT